MAPAAEDGERASGRRRDRRALAFPAAAAPFSPLPALARLLLWIVGVSLLALLTLSGQSARLDNLLYDTHLRHWSYPTDDSVVIVAIDSRSVAALGAWPWPRRLHAQLIDRLRMAGVRGIGLDVTLSERSTDHPEDDQTLAEAIRRSGRVVMPIFDEPENLGGLPEEVPPVAPIAQAVAALGQVDVAQDPDGIARGAYLRAGLGRPYWPSLALALYRLDQHTPLNPDRLPGLRDPEPATDSPYVWARDNYVLLRYAGPPGSFGRVSYVDVLRGEVPAQLLKNRWVLIGATATGLGDLIATPTTLGSKLMPGVEYQANVFASLQQGRLVTPLNLAAQLALGSAVLAMPLLLSALPGLRRIWIAAALALLAALAASIALLRGAQLWWPPAASGLIVLLGVAGWLLVRLYEFWRRPRPDGLTRLASRRHFLGSVKLEVRERLHSPRPLALLLVELRELENLRARYGRQATDQALRLIADALARRSRGPDFAARIDAGRFALLLPEMAIEQVRRIGRDLREELQSHPPPWGGPEQAALGLGLGAASLVPRTVRDGTRLMAEAERALENRL